MNLHQAICEQYSPDEALRFGIHQFTRTDLDVVVAAAKAVLSDVPAVHSTNACAYLTSLWVAHVRDNSDVPVHAVAGNLTIKGLKAFFSQDISAKGSPFDGSNLQWDGHVWLVTPNGLIGDISVFRTAYAQEECHWLRRAVLEEFGSGRGLFLGRPPSGWEYEPHWVLSDNEITALIKGLQTILGGLTP